MTKREFQVSLTLSTTEHFIQPAPRSSWKQDNHEPAPGLPSNCSHAPDPFQGVSPLLTPIMQQSHHKRRCFQENNSQEQPARNKNSPDICTESSRLKKKNPSWQHKWLGKYQPSARWFGNICMQPNKPSYRGPGNAKLMQHAQEAPAVHAQMNWTQQEEGSCGCNVQLLTSPENRSQPSQATTHSSFLLLQNKASRHEAACSFKSITTTRCRVINNEDSYVDMRRNYILQFEYQRLRHWYLFNEGEKTE